MKKYPSKGKIKYVFHGGDFKKAKEYYGVRSLELMIKKLVQITKSNPRITPHSFRRSFATWHYLNGVKI